MKDFKRPVGEFIFYLETSRIEGLRQICILESPLAGGAGLDVERALGRLLQ